MPKEEDVYLYLSDPDSGLEELIPEGFTPVAIQRQEKGPLLTWGA